ncbi:YbhB/YbcL family Raf kinase inhibitor-like protein [Methylobacterium sp. A54F]
MLEKLPRAVGAALSGLKAGLEKTACHAAFADVPDTIRVTSETVADGGAIPPRCTADGAGVSPAIAWAGLPAGTEGVVLLAEDADSPTPQPLVHLIAWNLPGRDGGLAEGALTGAPDAHDLGRNSFLKTGWLPPDPPTGHGPHRYVFQVYALDRALGLTEQPGRKALVSAMTGHVLARGDLIGTYRRD